MAEPGRNTFEVKGLGFLGWALFILRLSRMVNWDLGVGQKTPILNDTIGQDESLHQTITGNH